MDEMDKLYCRDLVTTRMYFTYLFCYSIISFAEISTRPETRESKKKSGKSEKSRTETLLNKVLVIDIRPFDEYPSPWEYIGPFIYFV